MKVNIYNRDRNGGHRPSVFSGFADNYNNTPTKRKFSKKIHVRALRRESKKATEQALSWWYSEQEQESAEIEAETSAAYADFWGEDLRPEPEPEYPSRYDYDDYPSYYDFCDLGHERNFEPKSNWELGYEQGFHRGSSSKPDAVQVCLHKWHKVQQLTGFDSQTLLNYFTSSGISVELT